MVQQRALGVWTHFPGRRLLQGRAKVIVSSHPAWRGTYGVFTNVPRVCQYCDSLKTGIRTAQGEIVLTFDADGQHNPDCQGELSRLVSRGHLHQQRPS